MALVGKQGVLAGTTAREPTEPVGSHHPVARHHHGHRVGGHRLTDGLSAEASADSLGQLAVRDELATPNRPQRGQNFEYESRLDVGEVDRKIVEGADVAV